MNKQLNTKALIGFALVIDFIILDQLSKWFVLEHIFKPEFEMETLGLFAWLQSTERLEFITIPLLPIFNLTMVWNEGVSFGLLKNDNPWPLIVIALGISTVFSFWLTRAKNWIEAIALAMIIGGALGNVIDRLRFGAVVDFLDVHYAGWHYPAFNIADSFITVGIVILLAYSLFFENKNKESK